MPDHQRIVVVSTSADEVELARVREEVGRDPLVVTAPTTAAARVVHHLRVDPHAEPLLAPMSFPDADRGHRLDELVRRHALRDRYRDVVVVTDPATSTLLLRVLAPGQLPGSGPVTVVGLARGDRPVAVRRAVVSGLLLAVAAAVVEPRVPIPTLPGATAFVGLVLLIVPRWRHLGRELLLTAAVALVGVLAVVAGSARFPGAW